MILLSQVRFFARTWRLVGAGLRLEGRVILPFFRQGLVIHRLQFCLVPLPSLSVGRPLRKPGPQPWARKIGRPGSVFELLIYFRARARVCAPLPLSALYGWPGERPGWPESGQGKVGCGRSITSVLSLKFVKEKFPGLCQRTTSKEEKKLLRSRIKCQGTDLSVPISPLNQRAFLAA